MFIPLFKKLNKGSNQQGLGGRGENAAVDFLRTKGYKIIDRNWYNRKGRRIGEIDIIADTKGLIVFCEVKTRYRENDTIVISPEENITPSKMRKLDRTARAYIEANNLWDREWRIDGISVIYDVNDTLEIKHMESIFY